MQALALWPRLYDRHPLISGAAPLAVTEKLAWQDRTHAEVFDEVSFYPRFLMRKRFESFNEVRLLQAHAARLGGRVLYEIGCATGEFGRYAAAYLPQYSYRGFDISRPAVERAVAKYGEGRYQLYEGEIASLRQQFGPADIVFCRDVVLHQLDPYRFLAGLLALASRALVLRLRTRDHGATLLDAESSCQLHYDRHWVPYIVLNTDELIEHLSADRHVQEIIMGRRYEPLGGHNYRYLPKDLYFNEARTAETAVLVMKQDSPRSGDLSVRFDDRPDGRPSYTPWERLLLRWLRGRAARAAA
jgi:SAM-dependent methyltransferase